MQKPSLAGQGGRRIAAAQLVLSVLVVLLVASIPAVAQPDWRLFGGFSYMNYDMGDGSESVAGWDGSVTQYISAAPWFGATAEVGGAYKKYEPDLRTSTYSVMVGPSFAYRKNPTIEPFAHVLFGAVGNTNNMGIKAVWVLGYAFGGGVDLTISKLLAVRGQADLIRTTFPDGNTDRQNSIRVLGGLVFRFSN